jgi:hypothetical protein
MEREERKEQEMSNVKKSRKVIERFLGITVNWDRIPDSLTADQLHTFLAGMKRRDVNTAARLLGLFDEKTDTFIDPVRKAKSDEERRVYKEKLAEYKTDEQKYRYPQPCSYYSHSMNPDIEYDFLDRAIEQNKLSEFLNEISSLDDRNYTDSW